MAKCFQPGFRGTQGFRSWPVT